METGEGTENDLTPPGTPPADSIPGDLSAVAGEIEARGASRPANERKRRDRSTGRPRGRPPKAERVERPAPAPTSEKRRPAPAMPAPEVAPIPAPSPEKLAPLCGAALQKVATFTGTTPPRPGDDVELAAALIPVLEHYSRYIEKMGPFGGLAFFGVTYAVPRVVEFVDKRRAERRADAAAERAAVEAAHARDEAARDAANLAHAARVTTPHFGPLVAVG